MLKKIKELFIPQQLLKGNCGIEREMLRVDKNGEAHLDSFQYAVNGDVNEFNKKFF